MEPQHDECHQQQARHHIGPDIQRLVSDLLNDEHERGNRRDAGDDGPEPVRLHRRAAIVFGERPHGGVEGGDADEDDTAEQGNVRDSVHRGPLRRVEREQYVADEDQSEPVTTIPQRPPPRTRSHQEARRNGEQQQIAQRIQDRDDGLVRREFLVVQDRLDHVHPREEPADHGDDSGVDHCSDVGTEPSPLDDGDDESGGDQRVDGNVEGHGRRWERIAVEHQIHTRDHVGDQVAAQPAPIRIHACGATGRKRRTPTRTLTAASSPAAG